MARDLIEIQGFKELSQRLKKFPDKIKKREVTKILRRASKDTIKAARQLAPKDTGEGAKSIRFAAFRRSRNPGGIVGPRSRGKYDGFHLRVFIIPGRNIYRNGFKRNRRGNRRSNAGGAKKQVAPVPFMEKAYNLTRGRVSDKSVAGMEKYIAKQINKL